MAKRSIGELEDELKARDKRIEELREEIDEQRDTIQRLREHAEEYDQVIESWCETLNMELTDDNSWTWRPFWEERKKLVHDHNDLIDRWNKYVHLINGRRQPVGRPLSASKAQIEDVLRRHQSGESLRYIAEDMTLGFQTVRTIVSRKNGNDRPTKKRRQDLERIEIDRQHRVKWKRQVRTGDALPKRVNTFLKDGRALITEAKGLGRSR